MSWDLRENSLVEVAKAEKSLCGFRGRGKSGREDSIHLSVDDTGNEKESTWPLPEGGVRVGE